MTIVRTSRRFEHHDVLILELKNLRINEWLYGSLPGYDVEAFLNEIEELCSQVMLQGQQFSVRHLVVAGLGCCVCPGTPSAPMRGPMEASVRAAVEVLREALATLRSQFRLEIFGVTGRAVTGAGELALPQTQLIRSADSRVYQQLKCAFSGDRRIRFRAFDTEPVLFHAPRQSFLWDSVCSMHGWLDTPMHSTIHLAAGRG